MHQFSPAFLKHHPLKIEAIDPNWNVFDQYDAQSKLIHFTNLLRQPWKFPGHPSGDLWFTYFNEAREAGAVTKQDIETAKMRGYVRQDILLGNNPPRRKAMQLPSIRGFVKKLISRA